MKKIIFSGFFVAVLAMSVNAQTVDEIINKHIAAMGGKEKMMSLKTAKMTAVFKGGQGGEFSLVITKKHSVGFRQEQTGNGNTFVSIVTPVKNWGFRLGQPASEGKDEVYFKATKSQLDLTGPFINYKEKGTKIELTGKETIDGVTCYDLKVVFKDGTDMNYYIDTKTNFIYKISYKTTYAYTLTNYKKNADGFWFPYTTKNIRGGIANYTVDNKMFEVDEGVF
jgi:hypothetical protein